MDPASSTPAATSRSRRRATTCATCSSAAASTASATPASSASRAPRHGRGGDCASAHRIGIQMHDHSPDRAVAALAGRQHGVVSLTSLRRLGLTTVVRTVVDLADVLTHQQLEDAVNQAEVRRLFDVTALEERLHGLPGRRGRYRLARARPLAAAAADSQRRRAALSRAVRRARPAHAAVADEGALARRSNELDLVAVWIAQGLRAARRERHVEVLGGRARHHREGAALAHELGALRRVGRQVKARAGGEGLVEALRSRHVGYANPQVVDDAAAAELAVVHGLGAVAVVVQQERTVVVAAVLRPRPGRAVVAVAGLGADAPELVDVGPRGRDEAGVQPPRDDPLAAGVGQGEVGPPIGEGGQHGLVEALRGREVGRLQRDPLEHFGENARSGPAEALLASLGMPKFKLNPAYRAVADQPKARDALAGAIDAGDRFQTLLGVTGSGKTATMAFTIEQTQRPALVIAHNKTLAAQLCNEFREFFPKNAVEYFVSYYDYYQPEAYVPAQDLYIEKDSSINEEIDRLRHSATSSLFARRDVIVVASVSCIFGLGSPEKYDAMVVLLKKGEMADRDAILRKLVDNRYTRNDQALGRGSFRVRGETLEVFPAYAETAYRAVFFGDEIEQLQQFDPLTGEVLSELEHAGIWPATHYATDPPTIERALVEIRDELEQRTKELEEQGKLLESHRLRQRTQFDMEMLRELGFCNGIENYSRILDGRRPGDRPYCLLDFFPDDFVCFLDESHQTVPQIGGMYEGDRSRKQTLVDYGFRLPSALDNRPQTFEEFLGRTPQMVFVSATPGDFEQNHSSRIVEQIARPTGIVDPAVDVRETKNQIDDLMNEARLRVDVGERALVTTLTKKMAEDLTDYLLEYGFKVRYLHSEIDTLERIQIIRELRLGEFDVLVGVNLLREGLDLPEVSLVAILDADKEGFLRGETSLIQTIGRAARNVRGTVVMYADKETQAMRTAIGETDRRRAIQVAYNERNGITPETVRKGISDITDFLALESKVPSSRGTRRMRETQGMSAHEISKIMVELEEEMLAAADDLRFEYAAKLRDEIKALRRELDELEPTT